MRNKKITLSILTVLSLFSCDSSSIDDNFNKGVNIDKPVVFYGTPLLKSNDLTTDYTVDYDDTSLNFNDKTIYVGLDYEKLAQLQADMIYNYIEENKTTINRDNSSETVEKNNILRYILVTDDNDSYFSQLKVRAIRNKLGTLTKEEDANGNETDRDLLKCGDDISIKKMGSLDFTDESGETTTFSVQEYRSVEMKGNKNAAGYYVKDINTELEASNTEKNNLLDLVICVNDTYSLSVYDVFAKTSKIPTFGFGGSAKALKCMNDTTSVPYAGTVYINNSYLAYMKIRSLKNLIENRQDFSTYGITTADNEGSYLKDGSQYIKYYAEQKKLLLSGKIINKTNATDYADINIDTFDNNNFDDTLVGANYTNQKIWYSRILTNDATYNDHEYAYDNKYFSMLNINHQIDYEDTNYTYDNMSEKYFLSRFINLNDYEGYLINLYNSFNSGEYISALKQ